ncbi:bacterio-opsin activator domain-containing protein [Natronomonas sp. EA1]|uniref:bacterio-opsin activator domain-containing protein n=1 Tax=Natronomonas sp. EA1 TaxID=3421655 RepID=UPI003EB9F4B4
MGAQELTTSGDGLSREGYDRLVRTATTYRRRLLVRLVGEAGLRPVEVAALTRGDIRAHVHDGAVHYFVAVGGSDERQAYLPREVKRDLDRYAESNGIGPEAPVFEVSARRLQMLIAETGEDAAAETGDSSLSAVSSTTLRRYFARARLADGVPPAAVMATGGWSRLDQFVPTPDRVSRSAIASAFGTRPASTDRRFRAAFDDLDFPAFLLDSNGRVTDVNAQFEAVTGLSDELAAGRELRELADEIDETEYAQLWETVAAGRTWHGPVACTVPGGEPIRGRLSVTKLDDGSGFVATFYSVGSEGAIPPSTRRALDRFDRVQSHLREVGDAVTERTTREGVLETAVTGLTDRELYRHAWVVDGVTESAPTTEATSPDTAEFVESVSEAPLVQSAVEAGGARLQQSDGDDETRLLVAVPLGFAETTHGVLVVAPPGDAPFDDRERRALDGFARRVASVLAAVEWKRLLLSDSLLELELGHDGGNSLFATVSSALSCTLTVEGTVPLEDGSLLYYVTVADASPQAAIERLSEVATDARLITEHSGESLLEVTSGGDALPDALIDLGAHVSSLTSTTGRTTVVCEVASNTDVREFVEDVSAQFPGVQLLAKREGGRSTRTPMEFQQELGERLTPRQHSVLQAAYHAGYFDWPRGSTGEELADSVGVSSPTLHNHLRRAQRKLLDVFFAE